MRRLMNAILKSVYRSQYKALRDVGFSEGAATWLLGSRTARDITGKGAF